MTLVYLAVAFAGGILAGHLLRLAGVLSCDTPSWLFPAAIALFLTILLLIRSRPAARLVAALVLFVLLGAWRYDVHPFERCLGPTDLASYHPGDEGAWATIEGVVSGYADERDRGTRYQLDVERAVIDGQPQQVRGRVLIEAARRPRYAYGDRLRVNGVLLTPPNFDDFDYRRYLAVRGIHSLVRRPQIERLGTGEGQAFWSVLYGVRSGASAVVNAILPEPAAALANGMVLGIEGGISDEVNDAFQATGTSHLIVISGSNIAFLSGALIAALGSLMARRRAALLSAPLVILYVLLAGADPPALRAGVMGLLGLGAIFFGRQNTAYVSLCGAGLVMAVINPLVLWDIGFQLSFATSLGLILFSRPLGKWLTALLRRRLSQEDAQRVVRALNGTLIVTVAAQAAALPLILHTFGRLSPVSLLANCLVLPVQPAVLASSIAALLAGAAYLPLGQVIAAIPWALLSYTVGAVAATAAVPYSSVDVGPVSPLFVIGYYAVLAAALASPRIVRMTRSRPALRHAGAWALVLLVPACLAWLAWRALPDGRLHVLYIPGEDAEAVQITAPDGRSAWLWDGRGDGATLMRKTPGATARAGRPDMVLAPCEALGTGAALAPSATQLWPGAPCVNPAGLEAGAVVALTSEVRLERIDAGAEPALLLSYGQFRTLLPATLGTEAQIAAQDQAGPLSVLKGAGPHTGAWPCLRLLAATEPQLVLWPQETTYPPEVSEHLAREVATVRVEADGLVEVVSDGATFRVVQRSPVGPR